MAGKVSPLFLISPTVSSHLIYTLAAVPSGINYMVFVLTIVLPIFRCTLDPLKGQRKLFGTPLVTYLGEDQINGVDIERAVSTSLSPLRRAVKLHSTKENGLTSEAVDDPSNSYNLRSMDNTELEESSSRELSFHLFIALDERGHTCKPLEKFCSLNSGKNIKVFLDWTEKEDELYDAGYLKDLPEVHKTGNTAKKTRQEAISLFTCLEAFLKEEPLGPSDMWYFTFTHFNGFCMTLF